MSAAMRRMAGHLRRRRNDYARLITLEMGKPIAEAVAAEIEADLADEPLGAGYDEGLVLEHEP